MNDKNNALEKSGGKKDVKAWLSGPEFKAALKSALPMHLTPDRFVRIALTTMMKTPKLSECTQASLFKVLLDCSSLGLEPDGRRAHIIPYNNEATLIIDYKGLIELAKRSGEVAMWRAETVCENDQFSWDNGIVTHKVDWLKPRGKVLAVYSHVKNKDGIDEYEVLTLDDVNHARQKSKAKNNGPWVTDFNEMAKKTAIRRHSKKLTLSPEYHDALAMEKDEEEIKGEEVDFDLAQLEPKRKSEIENNFGGPGGDSGVDTTVGVKVESFKNENFKKNELPMFDEVIEIKISDKDAEKIQSELIKNKRQANAFFEMLKSKYGVEKVKDINVKDLDDVIDWIIKD